MKKITTILIAVFALAFYVVPSTVFAQRANGQDPSGTATSPSVVQQANQPAQSQSGVRAMVDQAANQAGQQVTSASDMAAQIKNKSESTSLKVRQEICEQKRTRLQSSTQKMYQGAESVKKNLDKMYERAVNFYANGDGQLTVPDFEQKIQKLELIKQLATNQMTALQTREGSDIDCADAKTAARLEGDRLAGQEVKSMLKQYQTELVDLISSMRSASATEGTDNE
ncbi:hypothetical protein EOL73_02830 [Candidatus Saccharibacteria bacterium]|nr:hypothetical protein [Candidatus Saccharibacteria bacterium]